MTEPIDLSNVPNENVITVVMFAEMGVHHDEAKYEAWLVDAIAGDDGTTWRPASVNI